MKIIITIMTYFGVAIFLSYLIKMNMRFFIDIMIKSLTNLKEISLRIKYKKEWNDELEQSCNEVMEEYKDHLATTYVESYEKTENNIKLMIIFLLGWPLIILIILISEIAIFFDFYQRRK